LMHIEIRPRRRVIGHNVSIARSSATVVAQRKTHSGRKIGTETYFCVKNSLLIHSKCAKIELVDFITPLREQS
jgi:hypothetical protein